MRWRDDHPTRVIFTKGLAYPPKDLEMTSSPPTISSLPIDIQHSPPLPSLSALSTSSSSSCSSSPSSTTTSYFPRFRTDTQLSASPASPTSPTILVHRLARTCLTPFSKRPYKMPLPDPMLEMPKPRRMSIPASERVVRFNCVLVLSKQTSTTYDAAIHPTFSTRHSGKSTPYLCPTPCSGRCRRGEASGGVCSGGQAYRV